MTNTNNAGSADRAAPSSNHQLALGTISFAICFAVVGPDQRLRAALSRNLSSDHQPGRVAGSGAGLAWLARAASDGIADRSLSRTGRFLRADAVCGDPPVPDPEATATRCWWALRSCGMAGSSFAVGVGFVSPWFPREKQGAALGVYGLGNIGQSVAVFSGPGARARIGWQNVFRGRRCWWCGRSLSR